MGEMAKLTKATVGLKHPTTGVEYRMSPIEPADLGEFEEWAYDLVWDQLARKLKTFERRGVSLSEKERATMMDTSEELAREQSDGTSELGQSLLSSIRGVMFICKRSLMRGNPEKTIDDKLVSELITLDTIEEVKQKLDRVSGLPTEADTNPTECPSESETQPA